MKSEEFIALGLAAVAVLLIFKSNKSLSAQFTGTWVAAKEVLNGGKRYDNGWRYFDDGTAIDPQGNYYQGWQNIWSPAP